MKKLTNSVVFITLLTLVLFPTRAHAYLDANTGSYILQMAAAAIFGGLFLLKTWWSEIKRFVTATLLRKENNKSEKSTPDKSK